MLTTGQILELSIDKPAAGGRMIARAAGQVVLVGGAIPGEVVSARIERVGKGVAYAATIAAVEASPDRREPFVDLPCGGSLYAHISYPRQLTIKGQVIADAFGRIARLPLETPPLVAASPEEGYRMRARVHARNARVGFFREGTHDVCDARATRQLLPETCDALDALVARLTTASLSGGYEIEISENTAATERVVHLDVSPDIAQAFAAHQMPGVTGMAAGASPFWGSPYVTDTIEVEERPIVLRRHVLAFFQGNRYLLGQLMAHIARGIEKCNSVVDLYAGVGVFALTAALAREARVTAVEGDRVAAADLDANARAANAAVEAVHMDVERFTARRRPSPDVLIVDPPRTGMSNEALQGAIGLGAPTVIYVSCDVATLARDVRKLVDAGYAVRAVDGFDLFPNTPHVETVVRFERV